jgi:excisionase family DNA binding protein
MEKLYKVEEVAEMLNVTRQTIYNWLKDGSLKETKIKGIVRIKKTDLDIFMGGKK